MRTVSRVLLYGGSACILLVLGRVHAQFIGHYYFHSSSRLPWILLYAGLLSLSAYSLGLPDLERGQSLWLSAVSACILGALAISAVELLLGSLLLPRFVIFAAAGAGLPWLVFCAKVNEFGRTRGEGRDRVVVVAVPTSQAAIVDDMNQELERPSTVVALMSPDEARSCESGSAPLVAAVTAAGGTLVVLDRSAALEAGIVHQAASLHEAGLRIRSLSLFYEEWLGKLPLTELERMSLMFDLGDLQRLRFGRLKRLCDMSIAIPGLALLLIAVPFVLAGNAIANRGPLFYRQERVGKGGRIFLILKFRSMHSDGPDTEWTSPDDARITPWGRLLRRSHLDELPQVINVIKGEQSMVGPRPEQPRYVQELRATIPYYDLRHLVRPGVTGWAQVKFRYGSSPSDAMQKLQYDFYYLRNQSIQLDCKILARTLRSVMQGGGR